MSPDTAAALEQGAYSLRTEGDRADRRAALLREEADAFAARAAGLRAAADLMTRAAREHDVRLRVHAERYPRLHSRAGQLTGRWQWRVVDFSGSTLADCSHASWLTALGAGLVSLAEWRASS